MGQRGSGTHPLQPRLSTRAVRTCGTHPHQPRPSTRAVHKCAPASHTPPSRRITAAREDAGSGWDGPLEIFHSLCCFLSMLGVEPRQVLYYGTSSIPSPTFLTKAYELCALGSTVERRGKQALVQTDVEKRQAMSPGLFGVFS